MALFSVYLECALSREPFWRVLREIAIFLHVRIIMRAIKCEENTVCIYIHTAVGCINISPRRHLYGTTVGVFIGRYARKYNFVHVSYIIHDRYIVPTVNGPS